MLEQSATTSHVSSKRKTPNRKLTKLRVNAGLSPNELGRLAGCSGKTVRDAESGTRPLPRIQFAIAEQFDLLPLDIWPLEVQNGVRA